MEGRERRKGSKEQKKASEIQSPDKSHVEDEKKNRQSERYSRGRWREVETEGAFQQMKSISIKIQSSYSAICSKWAD